MTVIDLDEPVGKWFEMDGGGRVQLRTLTADILKVIRKQTVKKRVDFKKIEGTPVRLEYEEVNDDLQNELFWEQIIIAWENLFDGKGNEIPCTKENKIALMTKSIKFARFVSDSLKTLAEDEAMEAEASEKN